MSDPLCNAFVERACRVCGCTQFNACPSGCWWIEADLCSECRHFICRQPQPSRLISWRRVPSTIHDLQLVMYALRRYDAPEHFGYEMTFSRFVPRQEIARSLRIARRLLRERAHASKAHAA